MDRREFGRTLSGTVVAASLGASRAALAQGSTGFPSQPIRLIVPLAAGTLTDTIARLLAEPMARDLGQPVVVENRGGANGNVAASHLKQQRPDGHAVLLSGVSMFAFNPFLYPSLAYDPARDFTYVAPVVDTPFMLVASRQSGITTVAQFLERARARPGELTFASAGNGNSTHLAVEMVAAAADLRLTHVPYSAVSPLNSLLSGETDTMLSVIGSLIPHVRAGSVVPLAVLLDARAPDLPNVPTLREAGVEAPKMPGWYALVGPAGLPEGPVQRLNAALQKALQDAAIRQRLRELYLEPIAGSPATIRESFERDSEVWGGFIRSRGLRLG
ncbi:Bug family tripartite tricarboxylate transporter substrate binding protein [Sabulicella glaciei]|uniref:Tripartite tricarboxylate transporter substrate binding protein n=1 Tax=Sabulicella glaciei TaxID=2984948 RepID=A0ABT3NTP5_9PROT|nr:tripartite tricarboxylate transporter substrate binding protein [Roseococcus sp. MDT2-1-1]MCW8085525.1 tripartite tricarboxylate transporter substrate binding protein [Roseococcus sp. MDT2-1-1]